MPHKELIKVRVYSHRETTESLLGLLQLYGAFHPVSADEPPDGLVQRKVDRLSMLRERFDTVGRAMALLEPFRPKGALLDELLPVRERLDEQDVERLLKGNRTYGTAVEVIELDRERAAFEKEADSLRERAEALSCWRGFTLPMSRMSRLMRVRVEAGLLPAQGIDELRMRLERIGNCWDLHIVSPNPNADGFLPAVFMCLSREAGDYLPVLSEAGFQEFRLPMEFAPATEMERLQEKATAAEIEAEQRVKRIKAKVRELPALRLLHDEIKCEILRLEGEERAAATKTTFVLDGWIPAEDYPAFKHKVESLSTTHAERIEPAEGEEPPVALENGPFSSPFEVITDLFARPRPDEFDPTPFLAPFFAIYFGICLTDAGYGLVLLMASYLLLRRLQPDGMSGKLLVTLGICGASTVVMGLLTGGFFGILNSPEASKALPAVGRALKPIQWFDPMGDQMFFFRLVLLLGVIQVSFGFLLAAWANVKKKKVAEAIYDQASWLLMIGGAFTLALGAVGTISTGNARLVGGAMMALGGLIVLLFSGRDNENLFVRLAAGLYGLYGITGIFGDVLSYARLLALGIATGVIAGVINTVAAMCLGIPYGIGVVMFLAILVFGHIANIAINCMGAFVHTMRLQFVEFFTKFYEGGGEPFSPLTEQREYTIVRRRKARH